MPGNSFFYTAIIASEKWQRRLSKQIMIHRNFRIFNHCSQSLILHWKLNTIHQVMTKLSTAQNKFFHNEASFYNFFQKIFPISRSIRRCWVSVLSTHQLFVCTQLKIHFWKKIILHSDWRAHFGADPWNQNMFIPIHNWTYPLYLFYSQSPINKLIFL